jgi:hypothetical protein
VATLTTASSRAKQNVNSQPVVNPEKVILLPPYIKLSLKEHFVKAMNQNGSRLLNLKQKLPWISNAKIKEGIFVGP